MSRIGKQPIPVPDGVTVDVGDGSVSVTGPNGSLSQAVDRDIKVTVDGGEVRVERPSD
ncbi:MAG: 50S ribosomal protein L6, partial [Actinomycetota bacterium]